MFVQLFQNPQKYNVFETHLIREKRMKSCPHFFKLHLVILGS